MNFGAVLKFEVNVLGHASPDLAKIAPENEPHLDMGPSLDRPGGTHVAVGCDAKKVPDPKNSYPGPKSRNPTRGSPLIGYVFGYQDPTGRWVYVTYARDPMKWHESHLRAGKSEFDKVLQSLNGTSQQLVGPLL